MAKSKLLTVSLGEHADGAIAAIDVERLVVSRLLIQGGSGSGKSTLARLILEQTAGKLQQIVIDAEGEFATLKQIGDYLLASADDSGDVATVVRTAHLLARKIRETGVSAVIDVYDLKPKERKEYVARFLEGLIAAPKKYYRDSLVFIDESHMFAPQSQSAVSLEAVQDLAARGRKRKLGLICATHRISKLHKDVVAELQNRIIGQVGLKNDLQSASEEMGLTFREAREALLRLEPGHFWSFGPALAPEYQLFKAALPTTAAATASTAPVKASASLAKVLEALADLPRQAEREAQTLAEVKAELAAARAENRRLTRTAGHAGPSDAEIRRRIAEALKEPAQQMDLLRRHNEALDRQLRNTVSTLNGASRHASVLAELLQKVDGLEIPAPPAAPARKVDTPARKIDSPLRRQAESANSELSVPQQRILNAIASMEAVRVPKPRKTVVAALAGASPKSSAFTNNLGRLRTLGLIDYGQDKNAFLTEAGQLAAEWPAENLTLEAYHRAWFAILSRPQGAIIEACLKHRSQALPKTELADLAGASATSSAFTNNLGRLRTLGLIDYPQPGAVRATGLLFPGDLA